MQTILGSGGAIGTELARSLSIFTKDLRLVSRNPVKVNETDQLMSADLLDSEAVKKAVKGSSVVYVTVGFPYNKKFWKVHWPKFMRAVLDACIQSGSKLVFFDNIYMYDPNHLNGMTEDTPVNPCSEKGKVRAEVAGMILDEIRQGNIKALIARSADFYGPGIRQTSVLNEMVIKNLAAGKKANWLASLDYRHSFTYTPDAAVATAILGNTEDAWGQVWHLPTAPNPPSGKEWIEAIAAELGVKLSMQAAPRFLVRLMGLFVPIMGEIYEMMYQSDRDYVFDSSKFEKRFNFKPTPYEEGIRNVIAADYPKKELRK
jgi:nucleoside-diphosphate-sugar epimerase